MKYEAAERARRAEEERVLQERERWERELAIEKEKWQIERDAHEKAERIERERLEREATEKANHEKSHQRAARMIALKESLAITFTSLVSALPKSISFLRFTGFAGIAIILIWLGLWGISKFRSFVPYSVASLTSTFRPTLAASSQLSTENLTPSLTPTKTPIPTNTLTPTSLPAEIIDHKGVSMALVPAGEFMMGKANGNPDEQPTHPVYLEAFYMDIYEVTNILYQSCVNNGTCTLPHRTGSYSRSSYYGDTQYSNHPVIYVDWSQAKTYCEWRGGSLPTEAQWEKAARGGLAGMNYPWGDKLPVCQFGTENGAKYDDNNQCNDTDTEQVGRYLANGYGLYDMAGNVWEWVADWYGAYDFNSPSTNPMGPDSGHVRVLRGGAWKYYFENDLHVYNRGWSVPENTQDSIGFRCAQDAIP